MLHETQTIEYATNRELTGNALQEFQLRKVGKAWDGVPLPGVRVPDLSANAFQEFRRMAVAGERLTEADVRISDAALVDNLRLGEGKDLKRAAVLAFHDEPDRWVTGCHVKIGYFTSEADLAYQDELGGPLVTLAKRVVDLLYTKYLTAMVSYRGIYRVETFPVPRAACREAIVNAIVHKDYSTGVPIQIKVLPDRIMIGNTGRLPEDWTVDDLINSHASIPHNPDIANTFFRSGQIEAWGRGIEQMRKVCVDAGVPAPEFRAKGIGFDITFPFAATFPPRGVSQNATSTTPDVVDSVVDSVVGGVRVTRVQRLILNQMVADEMTTAAALARVVGVTPRRVQSNIRALKDAGLVSRVGSDRSGRWVVHWEVPRD